LFRLPGLIAAVFKDFLIIPREGGKLDSDVEPVPALAIALRGNSEEVR
jgi:hypothetical protein